MLTVACTKWYDLTEPRSSSAPLLAFMTAKDVITDKIDADFPRSSRFRLTLVERKLGEGNRMEVHYDLVRLWDYETTDDPMDHKSNEGTRSPTCLQSSYKPFGAGCQAQHDHMVNNESVLYSLENDPSKINRQAVLDWGAGTPVLSVAVYLLLSLVRLRIWSADTEKFPIGMFLPPTGPARPANAVAARVPSRFAALASQMVANAFPTLVRLPIPCHPSTITPQYPGDYCMTRNRNSTPS